MRSAALPSMSSSNELEDGLVRFAYCDGTKGDVPAIAELPAGEFIRRFLLHALPRKLMRIRHYGFLANRTKKQALGRCRALLPRPNLPSDAATDPVGNPAGSGYAQSQRPGGDNSRP